MIPNPIGYKLSLSEMKDEIPIDGRTFILIINGSLSGVFSYSESSTATPDDIDVVKPTDILLANSGRYVRQKIGGAVISRSTFYNNADVTFTANMELVVPLNVNQSTSPFITHSTSSNNSRITALKDGIMELSFSGQVFKTGAGLGSLYLYLKKNGTAVTDSSFRVDASNNDARLCFFTIGSSVVAGDYLEIAGKTSSSNFLLDYNSAPLAGVPNVPSVFITATLINNYQS